MESKDTWGVDADMYRGVILCTTSLHLMLLSVLPPFKGWFCGCLHNKILLVSTDVEVDLSEVEIKSSHRSIGYTKDS